jgi:hypothetical protein
VTDLFRVAKRGVVVAGLTGLLAVPCTFAEPQATAGQSVPPRRAHHALVYDESREKVLMTGGSTPVDGGRSFTFFDDLWELGGAGWAPLAPTGRKMSGMQLAWDAQGRRIVAFGGFDGSPKGDLLALGNGSWRSIGAHPEVRAAEACFVFDARRKRFVLFGGGGEGRSVRADTWEHDGTSWKKIQIESPPGRQAASMVFDAARGVAVLFGGMPAGTPGQPPASLGDTWEYDGARWIRREGASPSPRHAAGMAFDDRRDRVILFGGAGPDGFLGDTWSWDGTAWKRLAESGPAPRAMGYLAYDTARDRVILFGGRTGWPDGDRNDTWQWDGAAWKELTP